MMTCFEIYNDVKVQDRKGLMITKHCTACMLRYKIIVLGLLITLSILVLPLVLPPLPPPPLLLLLVPVFIMLLLFLLAFLPSSLPNIAAFIP
ncbi:hypothetical protein Lalb_Chr20g0110211 [Lupinus albus]|uniref:Transmembrane protein n=1 Tax=Lupinus albus TaxID=3870 RepID=A0A6A4NTH6_LUPAL|nr:hypothetical protein Lalb_Chr20g0110211 [Lupinus albus]